jgi:hypothetical protein
MLTLTTHLVKPRERQRALCRAELFWENLDGDVPSSLVSRARYTSPMPP